MFKYANSSEEIALNMEKALATLDSEKQETESVEHFSKAIEHLNAASELFETVGLVKEAEATTRLLEVIAKKKKPKSKPTKSKSKSKPKAKSTKKTDEAMKGLTSEKMVSNLKEKGWVFNVDDLDLNDDHEDDCDCSMCVDSMDGNNSWDMNYAYDEVVDPWSPNRGRW